MVDIHCHILHGLDDGAKSLDESVKMAEMAIEDGITHVVGTPHANSNYPFDPEVIRQRRDELQGIVGDRLTIATGCDFHLSFENLQEVQKNPAHYTLNQKRYLLVEFADFAIPPNVDDTLHQLHCAGLSLIITHPERNRLIRSKQEMLRRWLHQGCFVQVTAQALTGGWGDSAKGYIDDWLDQEMVHFVSSDAHNTDRRPLNLSKAYKIVERRCGEERAQALFQENPLAAFEGRPLPYEPEQPDMAKKPAHAKRRKRFWIF